MLQNVTEFTVTMTPFCPDNVLSTPFCPPLVVPIFVADDVKGLAVDLGDHRTRRVVSRGRDVNDIFFLKVRADSLTLLLS